MLSTNENNIETKKTISPPGPPNPSKSRLPVFIKLTEEVIDDISITAPPLDIIGANAIMNDFFLQPTML